MLSQTGEEAARTYIQRRQKMQQPIELPRFCELTGWTKPAAFRFMQEGLTATKTELREARESQYRAEQQKRRRKRLAGEVPADSMETPDATPYASSDSTPLVENLRRLLSAIG